MIARRDRRCVVAIRIIRLRGSSVAIDIERLILDIVSGRHAPSALDLDSVRYHVRGAGFDRHLQLPADRRVLGLTRTSGAPIGLGDLIPSEELHFLRHVLARSEWPVGTTPQTYIESLQSLATDPRAGILLSDVPPFGWHLAIVGRSGRWHGSAGFSWMVVEYRVVTRHWATGYQLRDGLTFANRRRRKRWLRLPT